MHRSPPLPFAARLGRAFAMALYLLGLSAIAHPKESRFFSIRVIDRDSKRGVPMVELETIHHMRFVTDSHGAIAIDEPELMGRDIFFFVRSHGYTFPKDGFGYEGTRLHVEAGKRATLLIDRTNVAERMARLTGSGIFRDSILLGREAPIANDALPGDVMGCDSVLTVHYRDQLYWFWGDTLRPHYPIGGNFHMTGATSPAPDPATWDSDAAIPYRYFVDDRGAVRPMAEMPGEGPTWLTAVASVPENGSVATDPSGRALEPSRERMVASYVKIRPPLEAYRWGFAQWDDATERFVEVKRFDTRPRVFLEPQAHTMAHLDSEGVPYLYFCNPFPWTRVRADAASYCDPEAYECYSCLKTDTLPGEEQPDRDADGKLRYAWRRNTPFLDAKEQSRWIERGLITADEAMDRMQDVATGKRVQPHSGSVAWNAFRQAWIMIFVELGGESSLLGEVWFAESEQPTGPWRFARKIASHRQYSFYNPKHHPFMDQDGGRILYFEGTYTHTFSGNTSPTPRYDYNQILYRLDLTKEELDLMRQKP